MTRTPASLLERLRKPLDQLDQEAWARFVELYTPLLFYWARRKGMPNDRAADLVQDVFLLLVKRLPNFIYDGNLSFRAWLRKVLVNKAHEKAPREPGTMVAIDQENPPAIPDPREALMEAEHCQYLIRRALELLAPEFSPVDWLAYRAYVIEEQTPAKVAADLHISINAVYLAKSRILRRLRQELDGLLETMP